MQLVALIVGTLTCAAPTAPEPCLLFAKTEIPAIRQRLAAEPNTALWQDLLTKANGYCTPGSSRFADPEQIDAPAEGVRIQVLAHRFGRNLTEYMETLGFAYQLTGEKRYAVHGAKILVTAARKLPASDERVAKSFAGARGDLMRGFAIGLDWLGETMPDSQRRIVEETAAEYLRVIVKEGTQEKTWWVPHHNYMGVCFGSAGCLAMKLQDRFPREAPRWIAISSERINTWFGAGFDAEGAYYEGTSYANYGLSNAVLFAHALKRNGGPDLFHHPHLRRVPHFFAMSLLPGERVFDARNDAHYSGFGDPFMLRLAAAFDSGLAKWLYQRCFTSQSPMQWIWENDVRAESPHAAHEPLAEHFPGRGLCVFRTGWLESDVMFSTEAGPFHAITHNQGDKGHFTLYGWGRRWAIDSGYGNKRLPGGRDQTVAHNAVLIDGKGQAISGAGAGTDGRVVKYAVNPEYGYALCDATQAYNTNNKGQAGATVKHALRHSLFLSPSSNAPAYAIVLDDIERDREQHEFSWLLHTDEHNAVQLDADGATILAESTSGGAFVETPLAAAGRGSCAWDFNAKAAGDYIVWARVRATGDNLASADSFFVQIDKNKPISWHMHGKSTWSWQRVAEGVEDHEVAFQLQPGRHTLRFQTREAGAQIDRVVITKDAGVAPPFLGKPDMTAFEAEQGAVTAPMCIVQDDGPRPPRMKVFVHASKPVRFEVDSYEIHPRLQAITQAVTPEFAAVLLPLPAEIAVPQVDFQQQPSALTITVTWKSRIDRIIWPSEGERTPIVRVSPKP